MLSDFLFLVCNLSVSSTSESMLVAGEDLLDALLENRDKGVPLPLPELTTLSSTETLFALAALRLGFLLTIGTVRWSVVVVLGG
jgi:hypothetical protein